MNIILFQPEELNQPLPLHDRRSLHLVRVLDKKVGETFSAGILNQSRGQCRIVAIDSDGIRLAYTAAEPAEQLTPLTLILGFPRPIQARRIFKDLASLGIERIILTGTELGEKSYRESNFFKNEEYLQNLIEGVEQAGGAMLPAVERHWSLKKTLECIPDSDQGQPRFMLHPYGEHGKLGTLALNEGEAPSHTRHVTLAIGSERGWTASELDLLAQHGFAALSLGSRILKTETACLAAVSILLAKLGYM